MNQKVVLAQQDESQDLLSLSSDQDYGDFYSYGEYQAFVGDLRVSLGVAYSLAQQSRIYELRESVYQDKMSYLLNDEDGLPASADKLDPSSYVFYCRQGDRFLASCRYTPAIKGQWESPSITEAANLVPTDKAKMLQVGRLLVAPEYRSQLLSEILLWASANWLQYHTDYQSFYGICTPALVRFYRHCGVKSLANTKITLPERQNKTYRIVYASMQTVAETLEQYILNKDGLLIYPQLEQTKGIYP